MIKETCSACDQPLEAGRIGKQRYCRKCHAEFMRKTRPIHSKLNDHQRAKANARAYLNVYIQRGKLSKLPCSECKNPNSEAHHPDYDKPLEVIWLCRTCHLALHKN